MPSPTITRIIKQMVDPNDNSVYIYPVTGIYSTFDENGQSLDTLLQRKLQAPVTPGTSGQFLMTDGSGNQTWVPVHDLSMTHRSITGDSGTYEFSNEAEREYATIETLYTATFVKLNVDNDNEHYLIVVNVNPTDTVTVGFAGANDEQIVGTGSIDIEPGCFCEVGIIKHSIQGVDMYVITERILEQYAV